MKPIPFTCETNRAEATEYFSKLSLPKDLSDIKFLSVVELYDLNKSEMLWAVRYKLNESHLDGVKLKQIMNHYKNFLSGVGFVKKGYTDTGCITFFVASLGYKEFKPIYDEPISNTKAAVEIRENYEEPHQAQDTNTNAVYASLDKQNRDGSVISNVSDVTKEMDEVEAELTIAEYIKKLEDPLVLQQFHKYFAFFSKNPRFSVNNESATSFKIFAKNNKLLKPDAEMKEMLYKFHESINTTRGDVDIVLQGLFSEMKMEENYKLHTKYGNIYQSVILDGGKNAYEKLVFGYFVQKLINSNF